MTWAGHRKLRVVLLAAAAALVGLALGPSVAAQQAAGWRAQAEQVGVRYTIDAKLLTMPGEDSPRLLQCNETIVFTNPSNKEPIEAIYLHLYPNAFQDEDSAFLRERRRDGGKLPDPMVWGGCEIQRLTVADDPLGRQPVPEPVPFEDAPGDRTVVRAKLPQPVAPGGQIILQVAFTTELPRPVARMGAVKDFVMAAQWFPKLGRYLGKEADVPYKARLLEGWYCHHYHATTEFAADFADYDVTITVPAAWSVGATGMPVGAETRNDAAGTKTQTWQARSVVDFAWTASARTVVKVRPLVLDPDALTEAELGNDAVRHAANEVRSVRRLLGGAEGDTPLPPVEVVLHLQPEHADQEERHFAAARVALALFGTWLGPYPYPRLTIVDPPHGVPVGGMEYPTLVTAGTSIGSPPASLNPEHVIVHEIGHQWFMNLLASNEAEEAWLDEGMNSWFTARAMHVAWGPAAQDTTILGLHFDAELPYTFPGLSAAWPAALGFPDWATPPALEGFRFWRDVPMLLASAGHRYRRAGDDDLGQSPILPARRGWARGAGWDEMIRPSWEFRSRDSYRANAYPRGMLVLETLTRGILAKHGGSGQGERRVVRAFREYARQFRFRHPTTADLLRTLARETEVAEIRQTFDTLTRTNGRLDFAVEVREVAAKRAQGAAGGAAGADAGKPGTEITLLRRGEVVVPVSVRIEFHGDAAPRDEVWDGVRPWKRLVVEGRVRSVTVDPQGVYLQDARLSDNVWTDRPSAQPGVKWGVHMMLWLEHALTAYGRFF